MIVNSINSGVYEVKLSNKDNGSSIETRLMKIEVDENNVNFIRISSGEKFTYKIDEHQKTFYICNAWVTDNYQRILDHERTSKIVVFSMLAISLILISFGIYFGENNV